MDLTLGALQQMDEAQLIKLQTEVARLKDQNKEENHLAVHTVLSQHQYHIFQMLQERREAASIIKYEQPDVDLTAYRTSLPRDSVTIEENDNQATHSSPAPANVGAGTAGGPVLINPLASATPFSHGSAPSACGSWT